MKENRVITIDEETFNDKTLEIMADMQDKGGPHLPLVAMLAFMVLQRKLFYPEKESEKKEQE